MKITYVRDVQAPSYKAGTAGETKDLADSVARDLIQSGHARPADEPGGGATPSAQSPDAIGPDAIE
jgi:hypothetical protein